MVQRVSRARVLVDGQVVGAIETGLLLLVCALSGDEQAEIDWLADKVVDLRIFPDGRGRTNLALSAVDGAALVVPQFTLAADWRRGRRPSFTRAAEPDQGKIMVRRFQDRLAHRGLVVACGRFGAMMKVELVNEGPFTLVLDSAAKAGR